MLTWDDEVKPSLQKSFTSGLSDSRSMDLPPLSLVSFEQPQKQDHKRTLHDSAASSASARRIRASYKRIINGQSDVNQLVPFKYKWAWEKYLATRANHWMPQEIAMARDVALWKDPNGLSEDERND